MWAVWDDRYGDLYHYDKTFQFLHTAQFFAYAERFAYPAPSALAYDLLLHLGPHRVALFLGTCVFFSVLLCLLLIRAMLRNGLSRPAACLFGSLTLVTSWPFLFLLERGNIEFVVLGFTVAGSVAYWRSYPRTAALFWGIAASMKIYPILLFGVFLYRRHARVCLVGAAALCCSFLLSFWFVGPTIPTAAAGTLHGISGFVGSYANRSDPGQLAWDHSFLAAIKEPLSLHTFHFRREVSGLTHVYYVVAGLSALVLYALRIRRLSAFNQFTILSVLMISLPPVSFDYTLCHLYPAFAVLVLVAIRTSGLPQTPALRPLFWCFALLFTSQTWIYVKGLHPNGEIKAIALFTIVLVLLWRPIPEHLTPDFAAALSPRSPA